MTIHINTLLIKTMIIMTFIVTLINATLHICVSFAVVSKVIYKSNQL
jgi:hypothetical protein